MKTILRSNDLTCPSCIAKIETTLLAMPGVTAAKVRFNSGRIEVEHDEKAADLEALRAAVRALGYETEESPL